MKIRVTKRESAKIKEFSKKEWALADIEHYGKALDWWSHKDHIITAYDKDRKIIGSLNLNVMVGVVFIKTLIITKSARGKGIGKQLIGKAEQIAQDNQAHKIYLQTGKNWKSVAFYKRLGFKVTNQQPNHYFHHDFVLMTKFI